MPRKIKHAKSGRRVTIRTGRVIVGCGSLFAPRILKNPNHDYHGPWVRYTSKNLNSTLESVYAMPVYLCAFDASAKAMMCINSHTIIGYAWDIDQTE